MWFSLLSFRASALKTAIKSKNQILRHLNQVLNISFLLISSANRDEKPIRCHAVTEWSRLLQKDSLNLTCVLDNSSPYVLERGWTLSITVFPVSYSPLAGGQSSSTNFSFPFQNLHAGETLEVSLPLAAAGDASFPVTVSCSLIFSLSSLLGEEAANPPGVQSSCISLPLNTLTVDWLHALQVNSPKATHRKVTSQCSNTATDTIRSFLSSRRIRCSGRGEGGGESALKPEREQYSMSVRVSSELLRVLKSSGLDPQVPQNLCLSLLEWLLSEGPGGVKTGHQGENICSSLVHAQGPDGHTVKLAAKEVKYDFMLYWQRITLCVWSCIIEIKQTDRVLLCSAGECWGGECGEGGAPGYRGGSGWEHLFSCCVWTASRCAATSAGTNMLATFTQFS